jgi:Holliday junction resolvasome RuvABC ATP-dependent DNA helicase subunit
MSTQPVAIETIMQQAANLSAQDKTTLAERLLADVSEQEQRKQQRIKNQAALDLLKQWKEDKSGYEEQNWHGIKEAIEATIKQ